MFKTEHCDVGGSERVKPNVQQIQYTFQSERLYQSLFLLRLEQHTFWGPTLRKGRVGQDNSVQSIWCGKGGFRFVTCRLPMHVSSVLTCCPTPKAHGRMQYFASSVTNDRQTEMLLPDITCFAFCFAFCFANRRLPLGYLFLLLYFESFLPLVVENLFLLLHSLRTHFSSWDRLRFVS